MANIWHDFTSRISTQISSLTASTPASTWPLQWVYVGVTAACLIGLIVIAVLKLRPSLKQRLNTFLWTNLLLGISLFFLRWQRIPLLGMDLWRFLQEVSMVVWLVWIIWITSKTVPQEKVEEKVSAYRNKYLPKAKKA